MWALRLVARRGMARRSTAKLLPPTQLPSALPAVPKVKPTRAASQTRKRSATQQTPESTLESGSVSAPTEVAEGTKPDKSNSRKRGSLWNEAQIQSAAHDYELQMKRVRKNYGIRVAFAELFRTIASKNGLRVTGYATKHLSIMNRYNEDTVDQYFGPVLLYAVRELDNLLTGRSMDVDVHACSEPSSSTAVVDAAVEDDMAIAESWELIRAVEQLIHATPLKANTRNASMLFLIKLEEYRDRLKVSGSPTDVALANRVQEYIIKIEQHMAAKVRYNSRFELGSLLLSERECEVLRNRFDRDSKEPPPSHLWGDYSKTVPLLSSLRHPIPQEEFSHNPFRVSSLTAADYDRLWYQQMEWEKSESIDIPNLARESRLEPAERILDRLKWRSAIERELADQRKVQPLSGQLVGLSTETLAKDIYRELLSALGPCNAMIPYGKLRRRMAQVVRRRHEEVLERKLKIDTDGTQHRLFTEYRKMFLEHDGTQYGRLIPRLWWKRCSRQSRMQSRQPPPFMLSDDVYKTTAEHIIDIALSACGYRPSSSGSKSSRSSTSKPIPAFEVVRTQILLESMQPVVDKSILEDNEACALVKMIKVNPDLLEELLQHGFEKLRFDTSAVPMIIPPRPWLDSACGGPQWRKEESPIREMHEFPHFDALREIKARILKEEQGRPVWDAMNVLGSTPWRINAPVLDVLKRIFQHWSYDPKRRELLESLELPVHANAVHVPTYDEVFGNKSVNEIDITAFRNFRKDQKKAVKDRAEQNSQWHWALYRISFADALRTYPMLFLPHNMDFRGRVYPFATYMSHMSDDVSRCLLQFAEGRPLGSEGWMWLKVHCANLTGTVKRSSLEERIQRADELLDDMVDSANRPLDGRCWWMQSDEPWQTLATCIEIRDALNHPQGPEQFVSHLPVHQDGSCNGLQHYAALGRDLEGAREVNLLPTDRPADVYSKVAATVELKRRDDERAGDPIATELRAAMPGPVARKVIKQTVMTTVYGVTEYGAKMQIMRQLKDIGLQGHPQLVQFAGYLADKTLASLNEAFHSSMKLKDWLVRAAVATTRLHATVEWTTPLGLPVVQPYTKLKNVSAHVIPEPIKQKQCNAFPPNFVHSLDSTHMMLTALQMARHGHTFAAIHDCYWTHASSVPVMSRICREQFVALYEQPIAKRLSEDMLARYLKPSLQAMMSDKEVRDFTKQFTLNVQPGQLDIRDVLKSRFFFS